MAGKCEAEAQQGCTERLVSVRDAIRRSGPERKKAIDHYTVYGGTLLIRNDADGRSYLYDLLDVQKKKVISKTSFSAETHSEVTSPKPSANSVPTSGGSVNTNHAAARKAAQLATIERNNPFDPELGAHTWIRSAEDILTYRETIDSFGGVDDVTPAAQHT